MPDIASASGPRPPAGWRCAATVGELGGEARQQQATHGENTSVNISSMRRGPMRCPTSCGSHVGAMLREMGCDTSGARAADGGAACLERRKCRRGKGTMLVVISFRSTFRLPSNRMEHVKLDSCIKRVSSMPRGALQQRAAHHVGRDGIHAVIRVLRRGGGRRGHHHGTTLPRRAQPARGGCCGASNSADSLAGQALCGSLRAAGASCVRQIACGESARAPSLWPPCGAAPHFLPAARNLHVLPSETARARCGASAQSQAGCSGSGRAGLPVVRGRNDIIILRWRDDGAESIELRVSVLQRGKQAGPHARPCRAVAVNPLAARLQQLPRMPVQRTRAATQRMHEKKGLW